MMMMMIVLDMIKLPSVTVYKGKGFNLDATCKDAEKIALEHYNETESRGY